MLDLIWWQFKYSWKKWLGTLFVFIIAGLFLGFTSIGSFSTIQAHLNYGNFNPVQLFMMPTIFGLITLILIINGMTRLLINSFQKEYSLWSILGANPNQLSKLISSQMAIISLVGGIIGYCLSYPLVTRLYAWVRTSPGMQQFPQVPFHFSWRSLLITLLSIGIISWVISFFDAHKIFISKASHFHHWYKLTKWGMTPLSWLGSLISIGGLVFIYNLFFMDTTQLRNLLGAYNQSLVSLYTPLFLGTIFIVIIAFSLAAPIILPLIVRLIGQIILPHRLKTFSTAYWNVFVRKDFLKSVVMPLFILATLCSFFAYLAIDLANIASKRSFAGLLGTLTMFLGTPFLIIFANAISITIISSPQRNYNVQQLKILGFSMKDLLTEKYWEALIYALVIFISGSMNNAFLFGAIIRAAHNTGVVVKDNWLSIFIFPIICGFLAFLFVIIIDTLHIYRTNRQKVSNTSIK